MVSAGSMPNETGKNKYTENETDSATVMSGSSDNEAHLSVDQPSKSKSSNLKGAVFITSLAGASLLFGFGATVAMAKKKDPTMFAKTLVPSREIPETGHSFAARALAWGTLYSVSGFSLFCFGVWKMLGVHSLVEFREKMQNLFPQAKAKKSAQNGRTEFANLTDLMQYIIDLDAEEKRKKQSLKSSLGSRVTEN